MNDPAKFDDDWAELARELERDAPASPPPPAHSSLPHSSDPVVVEESYSITHIEQTEESAGEDDFEEASVEIDAEGDSETTDEAGAGEGAPGGGRKRRRRRRRRRKGGGQTADAAASDELESEKPVAGEAESDEATYETETSVADTEYSDDPGEEVMEEISGASTMDEFDEDAGGELLRELIANWNVPSWDDVVSGLYRPDR